ncbi:MAG: hypothetical protein JJ879_10645 [Sneathiella sp.]|nr:hypothetical protein [Sneathiella sp.]
MSFSMQSQHRICIAEETALGDVPVPANLKQIRFTGTELGLRRKMVESDEIRHDRQIGDVIPGISQIEGDIDFELSFGAFDDLMAAAFCSSWSGNELTTGHQTRSFTIERGFTDIDEYQIYYGCVIDEVSLTVQPESLITGRFGIMGQRMTHQGTPLDPDPEAPAAYAPLDSFRAEIWEGGSRLAHVTGIDLKIENGTARAFALGDQNAVGLIPGISRVTGSLSAFFEVDSLIQKAITATASSLEIRLSGGDGDYQILLPKVQFSGLDIPVKGERAVIMTLPFTGVYDPAVGSNIKITRIPE